MQVTKHASENPPGFETQGRHHQKSKTGVSVALTKRTDILPNNFKRKIYVRYNAVFILSDSGLKYLPLGTVDLRSY